MRIKECNLIFYLDKLDLINFLFSFPNLLTLVWLKSYWYYFTNSHFSNGLLFTIFILSTPSSYNKKAFTQAKYNSIASLPSRLLLLAEEIEDIY